MLRVILFFIKDFLKSYVIEIVMLLGALCLIYHFDKVAVTITFAIFSLHILPITSLLLVLLHRFILIRRGIELSISLIASSFFIWLITYFLAYYPLKSFLQEYSSMTFDGIELRFSNIWVCDIYVIIADLFMIMAILCVYYFCKKKETKNKEEQLITDNGNI